MSESQFHVVNGTVVTRDGLLNGATIRVVGDRIALITPLERIASEAIDLGGGWLVTWFQPELNMAPPVWAIAAGVGMALATGLVFGMAPARRAARLDPVLALARH